jgi:hypothetical protein
MLLDLKNNQVIINSEVLTIPEFKKLWDSDKTKSKENAILLFTYMYHVCDFSSPYNNLTGELKTSTINKDLMGDSKYKMSDILIAAIVKYKELTETPEMRLLTSWKNKIDEMARFINNTKIDINNVTVLTKVGIDMEKILTASQKLEDVVKKQKESKNSKIRGNKVAALFED